MKTVAQLHRHILALISRGVVRATSDDEFNELALEVFAFQFERNKIYRSWCETRKQSPESVKHWKQIPAVPTSAFKDFALTCFPLDEAVAVFHTSGTTQGKTGKHFFKTLELYHAAIVPSFAAHLLPEYRSGGLSQPLQLFILTPSPEEAPYSSLSHMMGVVWERMKEERGRKKGNSPFFVRNEKSDVGRLASGLRRVQADNQPVLFLGTAFSSVHFFEYCEGEKLAFNLPTGSRAMETGGFKGKSREMTKEELYALFEKYLGIPLSRVVNEYGMTELSTQFYDETLCVGKQSDRKSIPPWSRVLIIDPTTGKEASAGERGLVRVFDLANLYSVMAIQTEDVGVVRGEGFEVCGRATGAEARGCSIAADEMLNEDENQTVSHAKAPRREVS